MSEQDTQENSTCVCTLKWFNESKGFGFLVPKGHPDPNFNEQDAFVHVSAFQDKGIKSLGDSARVSCLVSRSDKGLFVDEVLELLDEGDYETQRIKIPLPPEAGQTYDLDGTIKWYRPEKGYGFVAGNDHKKDVFIHQTVLKRNGIDDHNLEKGMHVVMKVRDVDQGREAVEITIDSREKDDGSEQDGTVVNLESNKAADHRPINNGDDSTQENEVAASAEPHDDHIF